MLYINAQVSGYVLTWMGADLFDLRIDDGSWGIVMTYR
jgi:hypothetical protein